ncbi:hypothetical protein C3F09_01130 [candidate division GN15 bacterium]|uniref:Carboxypeptidase regulatory-like domain-containing protein n=1 Tax=candidate division GN15 bacterium TaxID=2072418 RepID=A0A855X7R1_9BACT|nr:MAG: hypothetical protein C3F09_01130 [candidate division GN15 bacterium]
MLAAHAGRAAELEQIAISFEVPKVVSRDMLVQYDGTAMYLPVAEILRLIDINCSFDPKDQTLSGFFIHRDSTYRLDPTGGRAIIKSRDYPLLASDCFIAGNDIFLRLDLFQTLFGLPLQFDFSLLRVLLPLDESFPSYQKLKRQQARAKLQRTEERLYNVREVPLRRDYFSGGVADWLLSTNPIGGGGHYFDLTLGSMLLGGDFSLSGTGSTVSGFDADRLTYRWRYTFNPNPVASEFELGSVYPVGMLGRTMKGALLTNRPLVQRTHFQTVHITGKLEPGWEAEMYIDNKLVDFATSDQTGEYDFAVDLAYGTSVMTVKLFGPNGEVRSEEREVRIPYNLVPRGTAEYSVGAGAVLTPYGERPHIQSSAYYGITTRFTLGAGADIPAAPRDHERTLYGAEATYQILGSLTANGSFSPGNQASFGMNYSLPSFATASAGFTRFYDNPYNVNVRQRSSAVFSISAPFKIKERYFGTRLYVARDVYESFKAISINCGLNSSFWLFHSSYIGKYKISTYADRSVKTLVSQMLVSADLFRFLKPQVRVDYDHGQNAVSKFGVYLNKRLFRTGQLTLSYERNVPSRSSSVMLTFNFFNQAAYFSSRMLYSDEHVSMNQMQRGSIRYDRIGGAVRFDRRNSVGYGTAVVRPFLDANNDGIASEGETYLPGIRARVSGVGGRPVGPNRIYYYDGLRPYDDFVVQVDPSSLDDPTLRPVYENFKVELTPNVVTTIDVPIVPASDVSGIVYRETADGKFGLGGIKIKILNISRDIVTELTTFNNGEFYYLGLVPGNYRAYIDPEQLAQFGYTTLPESIQFEVKPSITGTTVDKIEFSLIPKP